MKSLHWTSRRNQFNFSVKAWLQKDILVKLVDIEFENFKK